MVSCAKRNLQKAADGWNCLKTYKKQKWKTLETKTSQNPLLWMYKEKRDDLLFVTLIYHRRVHPVSFTSSGFTSLLVKSLTQSMKQFSVTLLYVPRNSLNWNSKQTRHWTATCRWQQTFKLSHFRNMKQLLDFNVFIWVWPFQEPPEKFKWNSLTLTTRLLESRWPPQLNDLNKNKSGYIVTWF